MKIRHFAIPGLLNPKGFVVYVGDKYICHNESGPNRAMGILFWELGGRFVCRIGDYAD